MTLKKTLTILGSDTSGGAGMQADLKTFQEHGTYGMVALTVVVTMDPNGGHTTSHLCQLIYYKNKLTQLFQQELMPLRQGCSQQRKLSVLSERLSQIQALQMLSSILLWYVKGTMKY